MGDGKDPGNLARLTEANLKLRTDWKVNRWTIRSMAGKGKFMMGVPTAKEKARGIGSGPGLVEPYSEYTADTETYLDFRSYELLHGDGYSATYLNNADDAPKTDDYPDRYDSQTADGLRANVAHQVAQHKAEVARLEGRLAAQRAELGRLAETDARTPAEKAGGEPAHPPYARMDAIRDDMKRMEGDLEVERRLLQGSEEDVRRLEERLQKRSEEFDKTVKDGAKKAAKHIFDGPPRK